jgi:hypothetical protein
VKQDEHRRGFAGLVAEGVDAACGYVQEVAGSGVEPPVAVVQQDRAGQHVERLGDAPVEVRVWAAAGAEEIPPVQTELTVGAGPPWPGNWCASPCRPAPAAGRVINAELPPPTGSFSALIMSCPPDASLLLLR